MPASDKDNSKKIGTKFKRKSKVISLSEAGKMIARCKTLAVLDGLDNAPMALIREAIRAGVKDLTLIPSMTIAMGSDLLVAAGCVKTLYLCFLRLEYSPACRKAGETKSVNIIEAEEPFMMLGARAAAAGYPFIPVPRYVYEATDLPKLNPMLRRVKDPYTGEEVYTIPPLKADICLIHAQRADEYGNVQCFGGTFHEPDKARTADLVIVSTDEIVQNELIRENPGKTTLPSHLVDAVVYTPFGAHPSGSTWTYRYDEEHLVLYRDMVKAGKEKEYVSKFVFEPKDYYEYLERVGGMRQLFELRRLA